MTFTKEFFDMLAIYSQEFYH